MSNEQKPREFWIQKLNQHTGFISDEEFKSATFSETSTTEHEVIHVIEYRQFEKLRGALEPVAECGNCGGCRDSARKALSKGDET